jgi:hypothetical protein
MKKFYNSPFPGGSILRHAIALIVLLFSLLPIYAQHIAIDLGRAETDVKISKDDMQQLKVSFSYNGIGTFGVETGKGLFSELAIPGTYWIGDLGSPKLPASKKLIEIPFGAEVSVKVLSYDVQEYTLTDYGIMHKIMPVQPSIRKDQELMKFHSNTTKIFTRKTFLLSTNWPQLKFWEFSGDFALHDLTWLPLVITRQKISSGFTTILKLKLPTQTLMLS